MALYNIPMFGLSFDFELFSMVLGIFAVISIIIILFFYFKNKNSDNIEVKSQVTSTNNDGEKCFGNMCRI